MTSVPETSRSRTAAPVIALGLIGLVGFALRLWGLTQQSLWIDEVFSLKYAGLDRPLTWEMIRVNLHGPLHALLLNLWCGLFGWGELALRLPQALASGASVILLFYAARPVFGKARALAGAAALAVNPFHIWYAQEARNYTFVIFFAIVGCLAVQRLAAGAGARARARAVLLIAAGWTAGLLTNLSFAFQIAAAFVWGALWASRRRAVLATLLIAGAVTILLMLPWEIEFYRERVADSYLLRLDPVPDSERLRGEATAPLLALPYGVYAFCVGFSLGPSLRELRSSPSMDVVAAHAPAVALTAVCFGALALAGLGRWLRGDSARRWWLLALIVPFLLAYLAAQRNLKVFNPRYVAVALPAFVMLLIEGASALRPRRLGGLLAAGALALSFMSILQLRTQPAYWKEDARSASRILEARLGPGDLLFDVGTSYVIERYYWPELRSGTEISRFAIPYREEPTGTPAGEEALRAIRAARRTYVLFYRDDFHDPPGAWEAFLRARFDVAESWEFPGVRIWRLARERTS